MAEFLSKLQSADDATKKKWMIIGTAVIMAIVIYVWLAYFNTLFTGSPTAATAPAAVSDQRQSAAPTTATGPFQYFRDRMASIFQLFSNLVGGLGNIFKAPREYIIKPSQ